MRSRVSCPVLLAYTWSLALDMQYKVDSTDHPDTGGFSEEAEHLLTCPSLGRDQLLGTVSDLSRKPLRGHQCPCPS